MKKTLTVNLGGTVFNIDEDAYQLLDKYLSNLRLHFQREEGSDEIMEDFENRISELFSERIRLGYEVITIEHVENIIQRMGKPEELFGEADTNIDKEEDKQHTEEKTTERTGKKRLMRDPDNKIFGGVAGGLAAYLGWDVTAIRLVLIFLLFLPINIPIGLIYIILWIAMPMAKTAADKLIMRGENVTIENIGKTVTDKFDKPANDTDETSSENAPRTGLQKAADVFVSIMGFILKGLIILGGIILVPLLIIFLPIAVVLIIALVTGTTAIFNILPFGDIFSGIPFYSMFASGISSILVIGIPVCALIYALCVSLFKFKPMPTAAKWVLLVIWIIALIAAIWTFTQCGFHFSPIWWNQTIHTTQWI